MVRDKIYPTCFRLQFSLKSSVQYQKPPHCMRNEPNRDSLILTLIDSYLIKVHVHLCTDTPNFSELKLRFFFANMYCGYLSTHSYQYFHSLMKESTIQESFNYPFRILHLPVLIINPPKLSYMPLF